MTSYVDGFREMDLNMWTGIAVGGLCARAQDRIRHEIQDHYEETFREELARGKCEAKAHARALLGLGDPTEANRAFSRTYLTQREAQWLERQTRRLLRAQKKPIKTLLWSVFIFASLMFILPITDRVFAHNLEPAWFWPAFSCLVVITYWIEAQLAPRLLEQGCIRRALLWRQVPQAMPAVAMLLVLLPGQGLLICAFVALALVAVLFVHGDIPSFRLWSKLGKGVPRDLDFGDA